MRSRLVGPPFGYGCKPEETGSDRFVYTEVQRHVIRVEGQSQSVSDSTLVSDEKKQLQLCAQALILMFSIRTLCLCTTEDQDKGLKEAYQAKRNRSQSQVQNHVLAGA